MRNLCIVLLLIGLKLNGQLNFKKLADFPGLARDDAFAVHYNNYIYAGFGLAEGFFHVNDWWRYNLLTATWQQLPNAPLSARQYIRGFVVGDNLYLFGGQGPNGEFYGDFWCYSFIENEWTLLPEPPLEARWAGVGFSLGGIGYLGLGFNGSTNFNDLWSYNPTNRAWQKKADLPAAGRAKGYGLALENIGLVGAGIIENDTNFKVLADQFLYYPLTNRWEVGEPLNAPGSYFYASSKASKVLLLGGFNRINGKDSLANILQIISPKSSNAKLYSVDSLPFRRGGNFVQVNDTTFYLLWGLGSDFKRINSFYRLTLPESSNNKKWALYPNPIKGGSIWLEAPKPQKVEFYSLTGRLLFVYQHEGGLSLINIPNNLHGLFLVRLGDEQRKIWVE